MSRTVQLFIPRLRMTMKVNTGKAQGRATREIHPRRHHDVSWKKISRSRVSRFPSEHSNDVSPIERGPVDVEAQGHVNVRHRVHQDCFERRELHDEMRAEMSLMVISVENGI